MRGREPFSSLDFFMRSIFLLAVQRDGHYLLHGVDPAPVRSQHRPVLRHRQGASSLPGIRLLVEV